MLWINKPFIEGTLKSDLAKAIGRPGAIAFSAIVGYFIYPIVLLILIFNLIFNKPKGNNHV